MKLSKLFWLCKLGVLVFFVLLILGINWKAPWMIAVGVVLLVAAALVFQIKYRCPYCHQVLDSRKLTPVKVCPHCKKNIEDQ